MNKNEGTNMVPDELLDKVDFNKEDFKRTVSIMKAMGHKINVEKITHYYLNAIDDNDSDAIKSRFYDLFGDLIVICPTYLFAKRYARHQRDKKKLFFYMLTHALDGRPKEKGVYHSADVPFIFGSPLLYPTLFTRKDQMFSSTMIRYWTNFVKHGLVLRLAR